MYGQLRIESDENLSVWLLELILRSMYYSNRFYVYQIFHEWKANQVGALIHTLSYDPPLCFQPPGSTTATNRRCLLLVEKIILVKRLIAFEVCLYRLFCLLTSKPHIEGLVTDGSARLHRTQINLTASLDE